MDMWCKKIVLFVIVSYALASMLIYTDMIKSPQIIFTSQINFLNFFGIQNPVKNKTVSVPQNVSTKISSKDSNKTVSVPQNVSTKISLKDSNKTVSVPQNVSTKVSSKDSDWDDKNILKYQKCKYPVIDPFDPATISYHNKPRKFSCSMKRVSIIRNEILRVNIGMYNAKDVWLYYILRIADSVSTLSPRITLLQNDEVPFDSKEKAYLVKCVKDNCPAKCGPKDYCCRCDHANCPADITREIETDGNQGYQCVKRPQKYIFYRVRQEFLKLTLVNKKAEKWDEYHHAFLKPPNSENSINDRLNIIMLHLDGASDANVQRQLKKTYKYLENHKHTVIYKKHSVIGDGTTENMAGFLTGHLITELPEGRKSMKNGRVVDDWPLIWKDMHKNNYQTWFVEEYGPKGGTFHYRLRGFKDPPVKHYYRPLWMIIDPMMQRKPMCGAKFHFENMKQYYHTYRNFNKYSLVMLHYLSHDYPSWLSNVDDLVLDFYKYLEREGHMNNTVFIMYGDHGNRASSFRGTFQGKLEERNPHLSIMVPPWFEKHKKQMQNLRRNKDVLTTHFDSYSTLHHIMTFPNENNKTRTPKGASYFSTDLRMLNRTCEQVSIKPHYCLCMNMFESVEISNSAARQAVGKVISAMNQENEKYADGLCEVLSLQRFVRVSKQQGLRRVTNYIVKFVTSPGNGLYEATITCGSDGKKISTCAAPDISRTNLYGSQPECIRNIAPRLARYCYCKDYKGKPSELEKNL